MGALLGAVCHPSNAVAANVYFSGSAPVLSAGSPTYVAWFEQVSGVWNLRRQAVQGDGTVQQMPDTVAVVPIFPGCDQNEQFNDGMLMGWGIAALMVMAWGWSKVRQQAR